MDLFHAITAEIENVISCHWLDEFRQSRASRTNSTSNTPAGGASRSASPAFLISRRSSSSSVSSSLGANRTSRSSSVADSARADAMSSNNTKLMDTEAGGESTQYESIKTVTVPHSKDGGQLGEVQTSTEKPGVDAERAEKTAENIRYGQNISESGVGGMTTTGSGTANQEGGYGGTEAQKDLDTGGNARTAQQYSAGHNVHDHNVGC